MAGTCGLYENEEYRECGTSCEPTCAVQSPVCTALCTAPGFFCKPGYVRDAKNRHCILPTECKASCTQDSDCKEAGHFCGRDSSYLKEGMPTNSMACLPLSKEGESCDGRTITETRCVGHLRCIHTGSSPLAPLIRPVYSRVFFFLSCTFYLRGTCMALAHGPSL